MLIADSSQVKAQARRGRGAVSNAASTRFDALMHLGIDDGWDLGADKGDEGPARLATCVYVDSAKSVITRNTSPDIPFEQSINAYRGCEHGCVYCYARPSHAYLGLSPGLDFETQLFAKPDAAVLLEREISKPGYKPHAIAMGTNTDPYQPIEKRLTITRQILEVLERASHPLSIVTKSHLITRDVDILAKLAEHNLVKVFLSVTTLDHRLARLMEPRAATPARRLDAIAQLAKAGVPAGVMMAPVIPALNDHEMEWILAAAAESGASEAGFILLRLPFEVKELFREWLTEHFPDRAARVMNRLRSMRGGRDNDPRFGLRMRGQGPEASLLARRFRLAAKKYGLNEVKRELSSASFTPPQRRPLLPTQLQLL